MQTDPFKNQYAFLYRVRSETMDRKLEAILKSGMDLSAISLDWHSDFWSRQNWREPESDLSALMQAFAMRIRSDFNQVWVMFSAGWDSWTVLHSFWSAGAPLDGLVIVRKSYMLDEEFDAIWSKALWVKQNIWPALSIEVVDWTSQQATNVFASQGLDWIFDGAFDAKIGKTNRYQQLSSNHRVAALIDDPQAVILDGNDKPKLDIMAHGWYARFNDRQVPWFKNSPTFPFFINTVEPRIHIKQCYLLQKHLVAKGITTHEALHAYQSKCNYDDHLYVSMNQAIGRIDPQHWILTTAFIKRDDDHSNLNLRTENDLASNGAHAKDQVMSIYRKGIEKVRQTFKDIVQDGTYSIPAVLSPAFALYPPS